jgi:hypothetical protein
VYRDCFAVRFELPGDARLLPVAEGILVGTHSALLSFDKRLSESIYSRSSLISYHREYGYMSRTEKQVFESLQTAVAGETYQFRHRAAAHVGPTLI